MKLTFLGTSAGSPTVDRNVTALALALDDDKTWYLVDCGEGTQHRLLKGRYTLSRLKTIFITHVHGDLMFGLPGLITSASMQGRTERLTICAPDGVESFVRHALKCAAVKDLPFQLDFLASDNSSFTYDDGQFSVTSHELSHRVPSFAYRFKEVNIPRSIDTEKLEALSIPRGALWGQLQRGETIRSQSGQDIRPEEVLLPARNPRIAIISGDNDQPELLIDAMQDADVLVHEATFTEDVLEGKQKYMHSTARMVAKAAQTGRVPYLILTHFSGRYTSHNHRKNQDSVELLRLEARKYYHGCISLAEDYGCWLLDAEHTLTKCLYPRPLKMLDFSAFF